jgi:hypothetical protein
MSCWRALRVPGSWQSLLTSGRSPWCIGRRRGWWSCIRSWREARVQQDADALAVPARGSSFQVLPAVPKRLEGLDFTLAIVDEAGRVDQEVYEVVSLATGKQSPVSWRSGHPAQGWRARSWAGCALYAIDHPDDPLVVWPGALGGRLRGSSGGLRPLLGAGQPCPG